ncbi:MAG: hypothetical protein COU08_04125 [Candidatus Harrisonbacteria bacterium CG10_big_fil_rev_8_21_14_0_10_42_17]|uniref:ATP synthase F1 complex delta/epsilon subunit N-terminal domain-containing protein n=1 Tax=Candidatus Harrisonbacteria bacterium CG10_big_fil_rev_8_21_14_0_10_42_17 TaxID=1974584 RepID=A0A2M6WH17_9BACT|nr:MAG: hypothetical protein COU08_04125 [Candidatus Harrisonbacteria bacterium CG10_big_fil_rev_8_21_14_0_10_42_17]
MYLHIYTLAKPVFFEEAQSVRLKTAVGELTILDNHRPLIAPVEKGTITVVDKRGKESTFETEGGTLEVRAGNEVNILAG